MKSYPQVYAVVRRIPKGRVATYGQVAALAGLPGRARLVGYALHALPEGSPLPWHRVIDAQGRLSLAALDPSAGLTQRLRLDREGVCLDGRGRVDLIRFRWAAGHPTRRGDGTRRGASSRSPRPLGRRPAAGSAPRP